jgi:beta-galactosidase
VDSYDWNAAPWADIPDVEFAGLERHPFCAGEFVWTGFDYLGEPTPFNRTMVAEGRITQAEMARSSYFGIVDLCGIPKDRYYLYRSVWAPQQRTLHILPHWNWDGREGKAVPVYVYTNGDSAELFLNGQSQGRRHKLPTLPAPEADYYEVMDRYRLRWEDVRYEPGELRVVAYQGEAVIGEAVRLTAGPAVALRLVSDRRILRADGDDLAYVLVGAMDSQGTLCPRAGHRVTFEVKGEGRVAGVGNGNPLSLEPFTAPERQLFHGKAMLILRTTDTPGPIEVSARTEGLQPASVKLSSR